MHKMHSVSAWAAVRVMMQNFPIRWDWVATVWNWISD